MVSPAKKLVFPKPAPRDDRPLFPPIDLELQGEIRLATERVRRAVESNDKAALRALHQRAKAVDVHTNYASLRQAFERFRSYFPHPARIDPTRIDPVVIPVAPHSREEQLFKITRGYWSMPYSKGYGRRMRFLVMDRRHQALIGIFGLQSPSADLACRDQYLGVPREQKLEVVNNTLDAYTVGATPAYASLLGGKLVAGYLCSPRVRQEYWRLYGNRRTTQLNRRIPQPLLAITTTSAFGRSSIYNRLKMGNHLLATPLGYTQGFGTLHLEELYPRIIEWLQKGQRFVPPGFGNGPKVRWQNIVNALVGLSLPSNYLAHGIAREVYLIKLVNNLLEVCQAGATADPIAFDDEAWGQHWVKRWAIPRAERRPDWCEINTTDLLRSALSP